MAWIKADLSSRSNHRGLFRDKFPVEPEEDGRVSRQLDWRDPRPEMRPEGWIDAFSGAMVLVEAQGRHETEQGTISARLWIAPTGVLLDLFPTEQILYQEGFGGSDRYQDVMPRLVERTVTLLNLPNH